MQQEAFEKLVGRAATPEETANLFRVKEAMGISDRDPFWLILLVLEHYKTLYNGIPDKIRALTLECGREIDETLRERLDDLRSVATDLHTAQATDEPAAVPNFTFEFSDEELSKLVAAVRLAMRDQHVPVTDAMRDLVRGIKMPSLEPMESRLSAIEASQQQVIKRQAALAKQLQDQLQAMEPRQPALPWWAIALLSSLASGVVTVLLLKVATAFRLL